MKAYEKLLNAYGSTLIDLSSGLYLLTLKTSNQNLIEAKINTLQHAFVARQ